MDTPALAIGFLGPQGSHSHQATLGAIELLALSGPLTLVPALTLSTLMSELEAGGLDLAILPYENALEGAVVEVLETLGTGRRRLFVHAEFLQPVAHSLIQCQRADSNPDTIHTILSHPMGLAQCRETLAKRYGPALITRATASTSEAVAQLAAMDDPIGVAAIANVTAAELFGLTVVAPDVSDAPDNLTRFLVVSREPQWFSHLPPLPEQAPSKCSLCFTLPEYPGVLMKYLRLFYQFQVNLTKLESRPTRQRYGDYRFFVDCDIDLTQVARGALLRELKRQATFFHLQGPYRELGRSPAHLIPLNRRAQPGGDLMAPLRILPENADSVPSTLPDSLLSPPKSPSKDSPT